MDDKPAIFVLDDDDAVRDSLRALLESHGYEVDVFASGAEFLDRLDPAQTGCLLLDVRMPQMSGPDVQQKLADLHSRLAVIIITGHADLPVAINAMKAGAKDFIEKPFEEKVILESIDQALAESLPDLEDSIILGELNERLSRLTPREHEVLILVAMGKTNKEVATELEISPRTVEVHRSHVVKKLEVRGLSGLVRSAIYAGLLPQNIQSPVD